ncbi:MAG: methylated-DNA--[protein]-cysteine S-methyltransferase [Pseudohongiellaceae bacterium]
MTTYYHYLDAPIGRLLLAGSGDALTLLGFPSGSMARRHESGWQQDAGPFRQVCEQLQEYFAGERQAFELTLAPAGTTFQQQVWSSLQAIPFGETWSYGQLATRIGKPKAARAVGAANGLNPIPVIIPCHRVIGANGKLTGFGGGLDTKRYLLDLESGVRAPGLGLA